VCGGWEQRIIRVMFARALFLWCRYLHLYGLFGTVFLRVVCVCCKVLVAVMGFDVFFVALFVLSLAVFFFFLVVTFVVFLFLFVYCM